MIADGLHHFGLNLCTSVVAGGNGVDADGEDDVVLGIEGLRDFARQLVDVGSTHRVIDVDVERANQQTGAIVMQDDVIDTAHAVELHHFALYRRHQFGRDSCAQQFVDGRSQHLNACLDDEQRDEYAQDAIDGEMPDEHNASRDERCQRDHSIEEGVRAGGNEGVALQLHALSLHVEAKQQFHDDARHDDHKRGRRVGGFGGVEEFFYRLDKRRDACRKHDDGDDDSCEVLHTPIAEGVFQVGGSGRQLRANYSDDARERVAQVVDGIHDDSHGVCHDAHRGLERSQQDVGGYADVARADDLF